MDLERAVRITKLRAWGKCEGCGVMGLDLQAHHRQARGMGGVHSVAAQDANDPRNLLALCSVRCHPETEHADSWQATEQVGWRIPAFVEDAYAVPALLYTVNFVGQAWYLLGQNGGYKWLDPHDLPPMAQATWTRLAEDPMDLAASPGSVSAARQRITYGTLSGVR